MISVVDLMHILVSKVSLNLLDIVKSENQGLITLATVQGLIFTHIFNSSLTLQRLPTKWKQATIAPAAKTSCPKALNDFRPIARTSLVIKSFEKLIHKEILSKT